jgi:hypothetical protein
MGDSAFHCRQRKSDGPKLPMANSIRLTAFAAAINPSSEMIDRSIDPVKSFFALESPT